MGEVMTHHPIVHPILQPMFETLHTERLVLRPYHLDDAEARWQAIEESRDHLRRYEPEQAVSCRSVAESQVWIIRANADWLVRKRFAIGIWTKVTNQYLGGIGLRPREGDGWSVPAFELGYWVRASAQGNGYVTEAVGSVTAYALEQLHAQRVEIRCEASNERSAAVATRLGFRLEGHLRNIARQADGTLIDELIYALISTNEGRR
jgi:ribosomal-protein-serine acetyltransferase